MFKLLETKSDLDQLENIAKNISLKANIGDIFLIKGELGVGKTTLARYLINSIFIKNSKKKPDIIKSPSFPIMINYSLLDFDILHFDLYRVNNKKELVELNFFEIYLQLVPQTTETLQWFLYLILNGKSNSLRLYYFGQYYCLPSHSSHLNHV